MNPEIFNTEIIITLEEKIDKKFDIVNMQIYIKGKIINKIKDIVQSENLYEPYDIESFLPYNSYMTSHDVVHIRFKAIRKTEEQIYCEKFEHLINLNNK